MGVLLMDVVKLRQLEELMRSPDMVAHSVEYLTENLRKFLHPGDKMLICFPENEEADIVDLLVQAVRKIGGTPITLGGNLRWKNILKLAFQSRATAIAGPPFVVLGVYKLAKYTKTPLYFRNMISAGYRCTDWMYNGIQRGLDCQMWKCFGPGSSLVSGFSCEMGHGNHIRDDIFDFEILDENDAPVAEGERGHIVIAPKHAPEYRYHTLEYGRLDHSPCKCGNCSPRLLDLTSGPDVDEMMERLGRELMLWTSILDCRFCRGECGFEMELVIFPNEKLPQLPTCAKQVIRNWDPETDVPFWFKPGWRNTTKSG